MSDEHLDHELIAAKDRVTKLILDGPVVVDILSGAIDDCNRAWGNIVDCLNARIRVRDEKIRELLNELASKR